MQGASDVTVLPQDTDDVARQLCAKGNRLDYRAIAGTDHNGSMVKDGAEALVWIDALLRTKAMSNCKALPRAAQ